MMILRDVSRATAPLFWQVVQSGSQFSSTLQALQGKFVFQASWKDTYIYMKIDCSGKVLASEPASVNGRATSPGKSPTHGTEARFPHPKRREKRLQVRTVFSDILYQGHLCATYPISSHWLEGDNLPRRETLTAAEFRQHFELPGLPVVMNAGQSFDRACSKWTAEYLLQQLQGQSVIAGVLQATLHISSIAGTMTCPCDVSSLRTTDVLDLRTRVGRVSCRQSHLRVCTASLLSPYITNLRSLIWMMYCAAQHLSLHVLYRLDMMPLPDAKR